VVQAGNLTAGKRIIDSLPSPGSSGTALSEKPIRLNEFVGYYRLIAPPENPSNAAFAEAQYYLFLDRRLFTLVFLAVPASAFAGLAATFDAIAESFHAT